MLIKLLKRKRENPLEGYLKIKVKNIFENYYLSNRLSSSVNYIHRVIESWLHNVIPERDAPNMNTLEVGAGTLSHIDYERVDNKSYDIIEPKTYLFEN